MMKIYHILILIVLLISSCDNSNPENNNENIELSQIDIYRIDFLLKVKQGVAEKCWPDFGKRKLSGTIHYSTFDSEYLLNPPEHLLNPSKYLLNPSEFLFKKLTNFKVVSLSEKFNLLSDMTILYRKNQDTVKNFKMFTSIQYFDTTDIYFNNPIAYCSDFIITHSFLNHITDLEYWSTMVIHEAFHLYQYSIQTSRNQLKTLASNGKYISHEELGDIFKDNTWFANSVRKENELILSALSETNPDKIKKDIDFFLKTRERRRAKYLKDHNFDIAPIECLYEAFEGGAKYIEFNTKMYLKESSIDKEILSVDPCYNSNQKFLYYSLKNNNGLCYPRNSYWYFYATGFNMIRLLEKLEINFKDSLYTKSPFYLEYYLNDYIKKDN